MNTFLCQNVLIFTIYIYIYIYIYIFTKYLKHFGLEMLLAYRVLAHFESKIYKDFWTISSFYVLNCVKHFQINIFGRLFQNNHTKKLYQVFMYDFFIKKWLDIHKDYTQSQYSQILYTLKALLSENQFCFFFLIFWRAIIRPSFRMPRYWH